MRLVIWSIVFVATLYSAWSVWETVEKAPPCERWGSILLPWGFLPVCKDGDH